MSQLSKIALEKKHSEIEKNLSELKKKLEDKREENTDMSKIYGSELCTGSLIESEEDIKKNIDENVKNGFLLSKLISLYNDRLERDLLKTISFLKSRIAINEDEISKLQKDTEDSRGALTEREIELKLLTEE